MGSRESGGVGAGAGRSQAAVVAETNPPLPSVTQFRNVYDDEVAVDILEKITAGRNLSAAEMRELDNYQTTHGANELNYELRKAAQENYYTPENEYTIRQFDKALRPLEESLALHRGFNGNTANDMIEKFNAGTLIGDFYSDAGYTSASLTREASYASISKVSMELLVPKGTMTFAMAPNSKHGMEREIGVHRNSRYKVIDAYLNGDSLEVTVQYVGYGPKADWEYDD